MISTWQVQTGCSINQLAKTKLHIILIQSDCFPDGPRSLFLSAVLSFFLPGLGVVSRPSGTWPARPPICLLIKWSALGYSRLWYKTTEWDPFFRVVTPSLNTKQSHNPRLVPAPLWLSSMVPTRCLYGLFPQAVEKQACFWLPHGMSRNTAWQVTLGLRWSEARG